jgi:hypothetical protein
MNAIRQAFANAKVSAARFAAVAPLAGVISDALKRTPRLTRDQQRGWSTNISFRTYNALKNQGVLA